MPRNSFDHARPRSFARRLATLCALALLGQAACGDDDHAQWTADTPGAAVAPLTPSSPEAPSGNAADGEQPEQKPHQLPPGLVDKKFVPQPGWSKLTIEDANPVCVFRTEEARQAAQFPDQVGKQSFGIGAQVVFGAYAPGCIHESCDQVPSLQCGVTLAGDTLTVKSKFWGYHKDGSYCTELCRPITASCKTPPLPAGHYHVVHGETRFELTIPSEVREPCFGVDAARDRMPAHGKR